MRIIDIVLVSFVVGAAVGLLPLSPGSMPPGSAIGVGSTAGGPTLSERLLWLRTPAMQRAVRTRS